MVDLAQMIGSSSDVIARALSQDDDLFDAEMESEDELSRRPPPIYDEDEEEDQADRPNRRAKARKAKRSPKPKRPSKKELYSNFSESQRILRERPLNLPAYKPKEKTIGDVLATIKERQRTTETSLRPKAVLPFPAREDDEKTKCGPRLSSKSDDFFRSLVVVEFESEADGQGVDDLRERFKKHCRPTTTSKRAVADDDGDDDGDGDVEGEHQDKMKDDPHVFTKPGASKQAWKEKLEKVMQAKRASMREKVAAAKRLDEEEIDGEEGEEEEEEEEAAMTDTDVSSSEDEDNGGGGPVDPHDSESESVMPALKLSPPREDDGLDNKPKAAPVNFSQMSDLFDQNGEEDDFDSDVETRPFAMFGQEKESGYETKTQNEPAPDDDTKTSKDPPDFYDESQVLGQRHLSSKAEESSCAFDDESRLFDSQGFFKMKSDVVRVAKPTLKHPTWKLPLPPVFTQKTQRPKEDETSRDDSTTNMDDFLGLCSGQFPPSRENSVLSNRDSGRQTPFSDQDSNSQTMTTTTTSSKQATRRSLFSRAVAAPLAADDDDDAMDEMLGLCSGQFPDATTQRKEDQSEASLQHEEKEEDGDDDDDDDEVIPRKHRRKKKDDVPRLPELTKKSLYGQSIARFFEEEAELSGDDVGSDEDDDDNSEMNEYEADDGEDDELALVSDIKLQRQVEKIHNKKMLHEDQEDVEAFKDRYLGEDWEEGLNLKTGLFRTKRYVRQADDEFAFAGDNASIADVGEDPDDSLSQMETARRKQRFERDSYLREERMKQGPKDVIEKEDEDSQTILSLIREDSQSNSVSNLGNQPQQPTTPKAYSKQMTKSGSFLNRSKTALSWLQVATANAPNLNGATRNSGFQSTTKQSAGERRGRRSESVTIPKAKRPKYQRSVSVFAALT